MREQVQLPSGSGKLGLPFFVAMSRERFTAHIESPHGRGALAEARHAGAAGGAACGDLVRVAVRIDRGRIAEAGFDAHGCAAARAAGSAAAALAEGEPFLDAASVTPQAIARELGGLTPAGMHGAVLAADALHRALGLAARDGAVTLEARPATTVVAMSGGVDSAVAAQLAIERGHDVLGVTLELWSDPGADTSTSCCSPEAVTGARALAHRMGIPHVTLDMREDFRGTVVDDFVAEHEAGRTPNPCVRCNGLVRFDAMLALAARLGAERLATGHYARIVIDEKGPLLSAAADHRKDQTYMLARLTPAQLERLWFPLGDLDKTEVRSIARRARLPVADKAESQDLCFLAGGGREGFAQRHAPTLASNTRRGGQIVDRTGRVLGRHDGQQRFTIGQRRGIRVQASEPLYVIDKDARSGRVVVGPKAALATDRVDVRDTVLHRAPEVVDRVKLRYRSGPLACRFENGALRLAEPVLGVAPGQTACLMSGERVVGAATIAKGSSSAA